jgi:hypothetical protein
MKEKNTMKRLLAYMLLIPAVFALANAFSPQLEAQRNYNRPDPNQDQICFYTDENFRGASFCAGPGQSMRNIGNRFNDQISSIRIPRRMEVTIYDDENFGGARQTYTEDVANLGSWNDRFTSFTISGGSRSGGYDPDRRDPDRRDPDRRDLDRRNDGNGPDRRINEPRNGACFYVNEDFRGQSFCLNSGQSERNVGGRFNDRISSIRVFGRARVTVYTEENYGGRSRNFDRDIQNLRGLNDRITSIRVR